MRDAAIGEVMGDIGFWVEDVEVRGHTITGTVVEGTGWRVIGSWDELRDAVRKGSYRSEGTYTTGEEGRTQFLSHPQRAMTWSGGAGRKWSPVALVEVDLADLPFRMLRSPEQWFPDDDDPTEGRIWPDVGTGLGIEGNIPLDRIKAVHLFSDGRIYESHTDWRALVAGAKQAVVADEDDWSLLEGDLPLTEADPDPQDPDVDLRSLSQMGVVEARCVLCGAFCGLHEGDYGDDWMFPVFIGKQGRIYCESCVFGYEHQFGKTVTASISKDAVRCTNAAFEAITGQCPNVEIIDGGHFLSLVREAGLGYEVLGRVAPTVRALMAMPEYQTGSYYLFTSGHAMALVDGVLTDTEERGPDGRRILGVYRIIRRSSVTAALSDFERGDRVEAAGETGSVVGIRGQGNSFTKGYILISFDSDPERPAWYPWREVRKVGKTAMSLPVSHLPPVKALKTASMSLGDVVSAKHFAKESLDEGLLPSNGWMQANGNVWPVFSHTDLQADPDWVRIALNPEGDLNVMSQGGPLTEDQVVGIRTIFATALCTSLAIDVAHSSLMTKGDYKGGWFRDIRARDVDRIIADFNASLTRKTSGRLLTAAWYHEIESAYRHAEGLIGAPAVARSELDALLVSILSHYDVPNAEYAYTWPNPHGDAYTSMIGWDHDGVMVPVVFLGSGMQDQLTVCHEAAHLIDSFRSGWWGRPRTDTETAHGDEWAKTFVEILARFYPKAYGYISSGFRARKGSG